MAQEGVAEAALRDWGGRDSVTVPGITVRLAGAALALAVAAVHVADQGGVTALVVPDWIGWGYPAIEAGGVLTALALLLAHLVNFFLRRIELNIPCSS
jgi:hypothetical protein